MVLFDDIKDLKEELLFREKLFEGREFLYNARYVWAEKDFSPFVCSMCNGRSEFHKERSREIYTLGRAKVRILSLRKFILHYEEMKSVLYGLPYTLKIDSLEDLTTEEENQIYSMYIFEENQLPSKFSFSNKYSGKWEYNIRYDLFCELHLILLHKYQGKISKWRYIFKDIYDKSVISGFEGERERLFIKGRL